MAQKNPKYLVSPEKCLTREDLIDLWFKSRKYWAALALVALQSLARGESPQIALAMVYAAALQILIGLLDRFLKESQYDLG